MAKIKIEKAKIRQFDVELLACYLTGLDYDEIDADEDQIQEKLQEQYGMDLQQFADLISALLPLIDVAKSGLTNKSYKGFADKIKQMWYIKMEV